MLSFSFDGKYSFSLSAQLEVENATQMMKEMEDALRKMFLFYGDDPKKAEDAKQIEDFLKLIVGFSNQFEVSRKRGVHRGGGSREFTFVS